MIGEPLVIGLGNRFRGDDAIGLEIARELASLRPGLRVVEHDREPLDLIQLWAGSESAIVVDALAGDRPGRIHRFDASGASGPWGRRGPASSHALDLGQAIELARALGRLPARLEVIAIEGREFAPGAAASRAVRASASRIVVELAREPLAG